MWKWIVGTLGTVGLIAGLAHVSRTRDDDGGSSAPEPPAPLSYWERFELADVPGLDQEEAEHRQRARDAHTEALARIIASEAGTASRAVMRNMAWIARNRSILTRRPMLDMAAPDGRFGAITAMRPMASSQPATDATRAIAATVLDAPQTDDPTEGATHAFNEPLQDQLAAQGLAAHDAAAIHHRWTTYYGLTRTGQVEEWVLYR